MMRDELIYIDENGELTEDALDFLYELEQEGQLV